MQKTSKTNDYNYLKFRKIFDYLKMSYLIQSNELLKIKKENEQLHQRVSSFNLSITSIAQNTITKYKMKDLIKEGLHLL